MEWCRKGECTMRYCNTVFMPLSAGHGMTLPFTRMMVFYLRDLRNIMVESRKQEIWSYPLSCHWHTCLHLLSAQVPYTGTYKVDSDVVNSNSWLQIKKCYGQKAMASHKCWQLLFKLERIKTIPSVLQQRLSCRMIPEYRAIGMVKALVKVYRDK